jgi:hypothetical protein
MSLNTIVRIHSKGDYRYEEHVADTTITPGMLLEINSDNEVLPHNSASTVAEPLFALENALEGDDVDDNYSAAEVVCCLIGQSGTVVNVLLNSGTNYTVGTIVESNGDGTLKAGSTAPIGVIEDSACDLSASGAVDTLHPVRLL